ncbi:two-component system, OmpR family, sensor kinase [Formivibrio citricus]|uniref:histidine kinase n=1 Tax=Formivibrio citricus TaxID=83765 RepID=A0A1I5AFG7_9NEIS|nr:ATP-binding protein [Formivibrio citricus]SFN61187.1 two-component system, OmpR family, sensor kinase [Formivibrio citricus]
MGRLFWKFFFFIWLAQLTATLGIGATFWWRDRNRDMQQAMIDASPPATISVELAAKTLQYEGVEALKPLLERDGRHPVLAIDAQGRELLNRPVDPATLARARQALASNSGSQAIREAQDTAGARFLLFVAREARPLPGMKPPPPGMPGPHPRPQDESFLPLIPATATLVASLIFAVLLAWYFAKPIRNLRTAFDALAKGNLGARVASAMGHRRDELNDLGKDFDQMASRLQSLVDGQRRLLHDVSHEMRSPLARLQVAIGLARLQPGKFEETMQRLERESERMDKLVGELLTLSRLEAGVGCARPEEVSMKQLVEDVVEDAHFEAEVLGKQVQAGQLADATITGQAELLHRALENVVRNAIRYTPQGGCVTVETRIDKAAGKLFLTVLDQGCGVAESELEAIFEPFNRGGKSAGADGHGLGLAIARRVLEAHGGSIRAFNRNEGGFGVEMALPLDMPAGR